MASASRSKRPPRSQSVSRYINFFTAFTPLLSARRRGRLTAAPFPGSGLDFQVGQDLPDLFTKHGGNLLQGLLILFSPCAAALDSRLTEEDIEYYKEYEDKTEEELAFSSEEVEQTNEYQLMAFQPITVEYEYLQCRPGR